MNQDALAGAAIGQDAPATQKCHRVETGGELGHDNAERLLRAGILRAVEP